MTTTQTGPQYSTPTDIAFRNAAYQRMLEAERAKVLGLCFHVHGHCGVLGGETCEAKLLRPRLKARR